MDRAKRASSHSYFAVCGRVARAQGPRTKYIDLLCLASLLRVRHQQKPDIISGDGSDSCRYTVRHESW